MRVKRQGEYHSFIAYVTPSPLLPDQVSLLLRSNHLHLPYAIHREHYSGIKCVAEDPGITIEASRSDIFPPTSRIADYILPAILSRTPST